MNFKTFIPHLIAVATFFGVIFFAYTPAFSGQVAPQGDVINHRAISKEYRDYRDETGEEPLWTNSIFGGMPTYQIMSVRAGNSLQAVSRTMRGFLPHPIGMFLAAMLCAYFMFILLKVNPWLGIVGALAFGMGTNGVILYEAGHNTKILTVAFFPLIIAGMSLAFKKEYLWGGLIFALGMGLAILSNHVQMVYYLGLTVPAFGIALLFDTLRSEEKDWVHLGKGIGVLVIGLLLAVGSGASNLLTTQEYAKQTMRGEPILENTSQAAPTSSSETDGLERGYAMNWSNGNKDAIATFIPGAAGGGTGELTDRNSPYGKALRRAGAGNLPRQIPAPLYHGNLPFTSGPAYLGAIVWFLFILGIISLRGPLSGWLYSAVIITFMISFGSSLPSFNYFLFDHVPLFSKFRSPSSALTVTIVFMTGLSILGLNHWSKLVASDREKAKKQLFLASGITAGVAILCLLAGYMGFVDFNRATDLGSLSRSLGQQLEGPMADALINSLVETRQSLYTSDALRSLGLVALAAGTCYLFWRNTISIAWLAGLLGFMVLLDFFPINNRYLSKDDFTNSAVLRQTPTAADQAILGDPDPHYRVFNQATGNPFQDGRTSWFHKSIGGYHPAKLQRYADIIDRHLTQGNQAVFNMLNTKYFIQNGPEGPQARQNPGALGNAWLVSSIQSVPSNNAEIDALTGLNTATTAVVHEEFSGVIAGLNPTGQGTISLTNYTPDQLSYSFNSSSEQLAVFSEVWYGPDAGWKATIDGEPAELIRVNYLLRGLKVPAGNHQIEMRFAPTTFTTGRMISMICSLLIILGVASMIFLSYRKNTALTSVTAGPEVQAKKPAATKTSKGNKKKKKK